MDWIIHIHNGANKGWALCGASWETIPFTTNGMFRMCGTCQTLGLSRVIRAPIHIPTQPPKAYVYRPFNGPEMVLNPADVAIHYPYSDEGYVVSPADGEINITNNDPENWKQEATGPYIPKGFQDVFTAEAIFRSGITDLPEVKKESAFKEMADAINHPSHYTHYKGVEVIDITEQLNFNRGNAVKYISRAGFKNEDTEIQDLEKAKWYVEREMSRVEAKPLKVSETAEAAALIEQMSYNRGTAVAFICHAGAGDPGSTASDLYKAVTCIDREIQRLKEL